MTTDEGPLRLVFEDTWGGEVTITCGLLDGAARHAFLNGHCHSLALAIVELAPAGWELAGMWADGLLVHVAARTPDGWLVDVDNVHDDATILEIHGAADRVEPLTVDDVVDAVCNGDLAPLQVPVAATFVGAVLANAGYDPDTFEPSR